MTLTEQLTDYVRAAFTRLYVQTSEADEAEREIAALARQQGWALAAWDVAGGLRFPNAGPGHPRRHRPAARPQLPQILRQP
jgi:hypothetical protein